MSAAEAPEPWVEAGASTDPVRSAWPAAPPQAALFTEAQQCRLLIEVERRSVGGLFMHLPAWLIFAGAADLHTRQPMIAGAVALAFLLNTLVRVVLHRYFGALVARSRRQAEGLFLLLLLSGSALWGGLLAVATVWPALLPAGDELRLVVLAICAAGTMTLSLMKSIRLGMPLLMLGPYVAALLVDPLVPNLFLAVMSALFLVYVTVVSRVVQLDYWDAVRAHALLAERAVELERLSVTDSLTQLHNRLYFDRVLKQEWQRAQRSGDLLTVLIIDLDHFKRINDTHGHPFGDVCLKAAAAAMNQVVYRPADLLARYGGEEFVALLPGTDVDGSLTVAERLLASVSGLVLASPRGSVQMSCSIGTATTRPVAGVDWVTLLSDADAALYRAKEEGRNRVVAAGRWPAGVMAESA